MFLFIFESATALRDELFQDADVPPPTQRYTEDPPSPPAKRYQDEPVSLTPSIRYGKDPPFPTSNKGHNADPPSPPDNQGCSERSTSPDDDTLRGRHRHTSNVENNNHGREALKVTETLADRTENRHTTMKIRFNAQ